jgi:hypothetical protein
MSKSRVNSKYPRAARERGQALILFALGMVAILGFASLTIDIGLFVRERGHVQSAVDASALAAAQELPDSGANAITVAKQYALSNDSELTSGSVDVTFRCIVGDRDNNGAVDPGEVPGVCNPGSGASFSCSAGLCWSTCSFTGANKCNTVVVGASKNVAFYFAPVLAVMGGPSQCFFSSCSTGAVRAAACRGSCGLGPASPADIVMILDRTGSMSSTELTNAKNGAKIVLQTLNPSLQRVALGILGASNPANLCNDLDPASGGNWLAVPFATNYQNSNGTLNTSSSIVSTINCLTSSSQGTNLGSPVRDVVFGRPDAYTEIQTNGRSGVPKAIILFTDGAANEPSNVGSGVAGNTGNLNCTAQAAVTTSSGDNNGYGTNPSNACSDGSGNATDTDSGTGTSTVCTNSGKDRHIFRDYNIALPAGATLTGVSVRLDAWADSSSSSPTMCGELSWNGGTTWTSAKQTGNLTTSQATYTLGASNDTWGHSWSAAETSNANFRLRVTDVSSSTSRDFSLDWAAVNVYYTTPGIAAGPCDYANNQATAAKAAGIEVFTLGYGLESESCSEGGAYSSQPASKLLADMATTSLDDHGHCANQAAADLENADGDHFLCEPTNGDLQPIFAQVAQSLSHGAKLITVFG